MGTDIHFFLEIYRDRHWVYKPWRNFPEERNCDFFRLLVGNVRNDLLEDIEFTVSYEPRGMPADVSDTVQYELVDWGKDAHSFSYFTFAELLAFREDIEKAEINEHTKNLFHQLIESMDLHTSLTITPDRIRVILWFDS